MYGKFLFSIKALVLSWFARDFRSQKLVKLKILDVGGAKANPCSVLPISIRHQSIFGYFLNMFQRTCVRKNSKILFLDRRQDDPNWRIKKKAGFYFRLINLFPICNVVKWRKWLRHSPMVKMTLLCNGQLPIFRR